MSAQTKSPKMSSSIDTSHLKVKFPFKSKYGNFIGGKFVEPKSGKYFDNTTPITNEVICQVPRSNEKDVEFALDAAHAAFPAWGKTSISERSNILLKIAEVIEKTIRDQASAVREALDGNPVAKEKDSENKSVDKKELTEDKKETTDSKKDLADTDKK